MKRWRRRARRAAGRLAKLSRRLGLLPYQPERWTTEQWNAAYDEGQLRYYGGLAELARYSVIVGYVDWAAAPRAGGPTILDVGCGTGLLRERLGGVAFSEYVGVDLSAAAVRVAAARGYARTRFLVGDVSTLDLGHFDVVVLNEVLYYAPDASAFLNRVHAFLPPDGVLVVSMWRHPGDRFLWQEVDRVFSAVDRVEVRNRANQVNPKGWEVALYRRRGSPPTGPGDGSVADSGEGREANVSFPSERRDARERSHGR